MASQLAKQLNDIVETRLIEASWKEFNRLQQERDIFAGQIIEQDEELEEIGDQVEQNKSKKEQFEREISTKKLKFIKVESKESLSDIKKSLKKLKKQMISVVMR